MILYPYRRHRRHHHHRRRRCRRRHCHRFWDCQGLDQVKVAWDHQLVGFQTVPILHRDPSYCREDIV